MWRGSGSGGARDITGIGAERRKEMAMERRKIERGIETVTDTTGAAGGKSHHHKDDTTRVKTAVVPGARTGAMATGIDHGVKSEDTLADGNPTTEIPPTTPQTPPDPSPQNLPLPPLHPPPTSPATPVTTTPAPPLPPPPPHTFPPSSAPLPPLPPLQLHLSVVAAPQAHSCPPTSPTPHYPPRSPPPSPQQTPPHQPPTTLPPPRGGTKPSQPSATGRNGKPPEQKGFAAPDSERTL